VVANCASHSNAPWSEWIAQVQLNTLNNVSEKTRADRYVVGYSDWKDKTTTLSRSQTYPLSITPGLSWAAYQTNLFFRAWIDYNSNGIYEDTELVLEKNSVSSTVNQSVTIPATAVLGTTTMRVSMKKDAYPTACETFAAGEVEDYSVVIQTGTTGGCTPSVPTKLYAKDITATTAKLVWAKVNNAVDYEYQLLYDDTSQPNGGALISSAIVSDTFANITIPQGRLRAFVRSRCAATWSAWSNATMFNQLTDVCSQSALTAFVQDFENVTIATSTSYNLPNCWSKLTYHAPSVIEAWTDVRLTSRGTVGNNTKRAILFHSTPLADSALIMLVSPEISNLAAGTNRLRFKAANTFGVDAAGNAVIQIGTLSNPFDASSFTPFGSQTVINGQVFAEYIVDFAAYHGSDRYLVFKYISSGGDFYRSLEIDDVAWEVRPSNPCLNDVTPPVLVNCPANISVTTTGTTALATWATVTATDNCTTPPSVSSTFLSGQGFPIGTTTVVYTARDAANNTTTCAFSVVVTASTVTANCVSKSNAPWSEWIANVQFNTINNTSSKTRDDRFVVGYSDWKDISTTVTRGQTALLTITPGLSWPGYQTPLYFHAWIDYNRNGIYEASELVLEKFNTSFAVNQSVTIPTTASIGTTTMRVSMKKGAYSSACESFDLGEVEDYTVVIQDGNPTPCANNVLNFDGNDDYLQTPQAVIPANTDFTMEASFTSTASNFGCNGNFKRLLSLELSASVNRFEIGDCAGQLTLFYFISGGATNLINIPNVTNLRDGNWHHVAAVKKGDVVSIYYDGVLVLTQAGLTNINNVPRILYVGRWGISGENWQGNVDEVRVWNYAVSATDILNRRNCQLLGNESGLVLYFPFNQGVSAGSNTTITTVIDKSPSNMTTPMSFFGMQGSVSNFVCSTQTLTQGCTSTDPCANDITPPVFQNCPQNINLTALTGSTTATATWTAPTATDNCSPPSVSSNYTGGGTFFIGTTAVVYTAKDVRNNTGTCSFNVVVSAPANTCRYNDSLVLVDFNIKTNGANWTTKWDFTQPINTWFGVYLNSNGCVGSLALQNNNLVGTIPLGLVNLSKLTELSLNGNKLTGTIPSSFGTLTGLTFLDLGNNQLIGTIPPSLTNLTQLGVFNLQNNQLTGTIPPNLGSMSNLLLVSFNDNQLIGSIPNSLGSLTKLRKLYLFNNQLSDTIPSNLGNITTLEELILYNNKLTGTIPTSLGNTSALAFLYLDNNLLSGCLPLSLKNLCNKFVRISGNVNLPNGGDWTAFCNTSAGACPPTTGGTNDLEVSVIANAATFKKWTNTGFKINLKNIGNQTFTNIELTFPYPTGTVNGGTPTPSVGTFQQYCAGGTLCYKWTIPSLAAGVTATLDVPLFVLDVTTIIGTAQLLTSTPTDANAANNTTTATMTLQTIVPSLTFKPTQLIPVVIQTLSPNPTDGELSLKLESLDTREVSFEFYNALGKAVKSEKRVVEKGLNRVDFSLFDLEQGVYFIVPSTGQGRKVPTKFVKL
jgi:Leucine-rich repeat (LRR) protein